MVIIIIEGTVYKVTERQMKEIEATKALEDENALIDLFERRLTDYIEVGPVWLSFRG